MKSIVEQCLSHALKTLQKQGVLASDLTLPILVEHPKNADHGDFSSNLAFLLAKPMRQAPKAIAEQLIPLLPQDPAIERVEIAGAGFINFFLKADALLGIIPQILSAKEAFGRCEIGQGQRILLEFVSANPTGPLHVGHGRGAAFGATLTNLLKACGYEVTTEYYVNDAGRQMDILAVSVWLRYLALAGEEIVFPANAYQGEYVQAIAKEVQGHFIHPWSDVSEGLPLDAKMGGDKELYIDALIARAKVLLGKAGFAVFHQAALQSVLKDIRSDLTDFGVHYDHWFSEQYLADEKAIEKSIQALKDKGHTYEQEGALWFKSSAFGDEKDRVLIRENGQPTYFASDVAYHWDKFERGFDVLIDVFGADHHGYVSRIRAAVGALGHDASSLDIMLVQFAVLFRGEERVQMSTRSGSFVTLRELREEVGNDAARFFYVQRKPEQHMEFDLALAQSQSQDNPVYYVQYAHARICSVLRQLKERGLNWSQTQGEANLHLLNAPQEQALMTLLSRYPEIIRIAGMAKEPHQLAYYLRDLANGLHSYYNALTLICQDAHLRDARLSLLMAVSIVLKNGLQLLGVSAPESM